MALSHDRALRREIARLARLDAQDIDAILVGLDPAECARVRLLLREYLATGSGSGGRPLSEGATVSPWLAARIDGAVAGITPAARQSLGTFANHTTTSDGPRPPARPSLIQQGLAALSRTGVGR